MDPSSVQQHKEMSSQTLESMLVCTKTQQEKKPRPQPEQALKCPRCDSANTKFCYYNNYSLTQPRYFCKSCKRYWTKGGTLRNVPVGGGCRKNKKSSCRRSQDQPIRTHQNPLSTFPTALTYDSNDLSLAFSRLQNQSTGQLGFDDHDVSMLGNPNNTHCDVLGNPNVINSSASTPVFFDALRSGFLDNPNGFHNLYYGNTGHLDNGRGVGINVGEEMAMVPYEDFMSTGETTAVTVTAMKQEYCNDREGENRVLWGFPWQLTGDGNMGGFDSGRESWNGLGSSWHGLLNSRLM